MDLQSRRALLKNKANPDPRLDYLVFLEGHLAGTEVMRTSILLRYVPGKMILDTHAFGVYLDTLSGLNLETPEDIAVTLLSDITNELLPRWAQVEVHAPDVHHAAVDVHGVVLEERQPNWDNPALLGRLKPL